MLSRLKAKFKESPPESSEVTTIKQLSRGYQELEKKWLASLERKDLIDILDRHVVPHHDDIESALCLGLGSFTRRRRHSTTFQSDHDGIYDRNISMGLYQLLIFETILDRLRSVCNIKTTTIQDPDFTEVDQAFLETRGHRVIPYPGVSATSPVLLGKTFPLDRSIMSGLSAKSLFFAPGLDVDVTFDVLQSIKPVLYWGHHLYTSSTLPYFRHPNSPGHALQESLITLAQAYKFVRAPDMGPICTSNEGLMICIDDSNEKRTRRATH